MKAREWISATWAEWRPTFDGGRCEVGPLILMTRHELGDTFREGIERGRDWERRGINKPIDPEPLARVLHLPTV